MGEPSPGVPPLLRPRDAGVLYPGWNSPICPAGLYVGAASSTPFLWSCPKKRGGAPKKNAYGVVAPP